MDMSIKTTLKIMTTFCNDFDGDTDVSSNIDRFRAKFKHHRYVFKLVRAIIWITAEYQR